MTPYKLISKVQRVWLVGRGYLLTLLRGSRGPSTVTLMAFWYRVICGGCVHTVIVRVKLFPEKRNIKQK